MEFQCCFCAQAIRERDLGLMITLTRLAERSTNPEQRLFAHGECLEEKFAPALHETTPFDPAVFFD